MNVRLIAHTSCNAEMGRTVEEIGFETDCNATHSEVLIEFAGRNCYQSWSNPGKKTNAEYIANILDHGHGSVLEHASCTFFIAGVSRSLTHELIRHRHLSFSELSQRYVNVETVEFIRPPLCQRGLDEGRIAVQRDTADDIRELYRNNTECLTAAFPEASRKQVREAARATLPNCTETKIVVTGNFRAWRHFIDARANEHADAEICALAVEICTQLKDRFPNVFGDYTIDGGYAYTHNRKV